MKIAAGTRRIDYDLIRVFACASVLIFHFNASVCGFDTVGWSAYPNELIPSVYLGCVSLGDIGNNLFFMLSGAVLMGGHAIASWKDLGRFYWSRIEKLMPPFYIAWMGATCAQLWVNKTLSGAPVQSLLLTLLGMDGYGSARGWFPHNYYQVGEWYLGCALICYLLWPVVRYLWDRLPVWVFLPAVALMYGITVFTTNGNLITIPVRLTQMIAGGCFARYMKQIKSIPLIGINVAITVIAVVARKYLHAITVGSDAICADRLAGRLLPHLFQRSQPCDHIGGRADISDLFGAPQIDQPAGNTVRSVAFPLSLCDDAVSDLFCAGCRCRKASAAGSISLGTAHQAL